MKTQNLAFLLLLLVFGCGQNNNESKTTQTEQPQQVVNVPAFNADSAYSFVKKQVDFGPRVPNTTPHQQAGDYFIRTFEDYGASVTVQEFESTTFDGKKLNLRNIVASFFPEQKKRILLAAHWDTRPFADKDDHDQKKPIDGANDGASGVAILLEIARVLHTSDNPQVGIDMILFDGEDWGETENMRVPVKNGLDYWWCLGSQYWAKHKHKPNYSAYYGILFDMVGGKNAQFYREGFSLQFAPKIVEKVWNTAERLGYSHIFVKKNQGEIIDDHLFVNQYGKIPTIDIVAHDPATGSFGSFHHTHDDALDIISKETLKAVGETALHVIYHEEGAI